MKLKLRANLLDIGTGGPLIVLLDDDTAKKMSLFIGDRVRISVNGTEKLCTVDFAENEPFDTIGIFRDTAEALGIRDGQLVKVAPAEKPASIDYIREKLSGKKLNYKQFSAILNDIADQKLTSVEIAYFISAIYMHGCDMEETYALTKAMVNTGDVLKWKKLAVSKHSIGGIAGNRTTMLLVPIVAAAGILMPKTSSRAITSPAGTADTMEVLAPVEMSGIAKVREIVEKAKGCIVWGGALNLAPADDKIIRVEHELSIDPEPILLASILGKKKSEGSERVLIDIPVGKYSKIKSNAMYRKLRNKFIWLGKKLGMKIFVMRSLAEGPIGKGVGPVLEARDVLWVLQRDPRAPKDLENKAIEMAGILLKIGGATRTVLGGRKLARELLDSGKAYEQMKRIIRVQGGDPRIGPDDLPLGIFKCCFYARHSGRVSVINDDLVAEVAKLAGAPKDIGAGVYVIVSKGDKVKSGDKVFIIYSNSKERLKFAVKTSKGIVKIK